MTEPGIGSDLASMSTTAIRDGDDYVVNGSKTFITNGINADLVITVKTDPSQRHKGMSLLILERGMEGFERGRNLEKVGLHSQDTAELFFTDVRVPVGQPAQARGRGLPAAGVEPAPGAARSPSPAWPRPGGLRLDPRLLQGTPGLRPAHRLVPEQPVPPGRDADRGGGTRPSSTGAWRPSTPASSPPRRRPWRSGGAPSCRAG